MKIFLMALSFLCLGSAEAAVIGKEVDYQADGVTPKGYVAYDESFKGNRPAVLVVHDMLEKNSSCCCPITSRRTRIPGSRRQFFCVKFSRPGELRRFG